MEKRVERREKERIWPQEKMHLCCNTTDSTWTMTHVNRTHAWKTGHAEAYGTSAFIFSASIAALCNNFQCFKYLMKCAIGAKSGPLQISKENGSLITI